MNLRKTDETAAKRYANLREFAAYAGLGLNLADKAAVAAGAKRKVGNRAIYDLQAFDEYMLNAGQIDIKEGTNNG